MDESPVIKGCRASIRRFTSLRTGILLFLAFMNIWVLFAGCGLGERRRSGVYHTVRPGETLFGIASAYGTGTAELARANGIIDPNVLRAGQRLWIPGGQAPQCSSLDPIGLGSKGIPLGLGSGKGRAAKGYMNWPIQGERVLTSRFGPRWGRLHKGVDFAAPPGTPVTAARRGQVAHVGRAGEGPGRSYGNYLVLHHGDGLYTLYAHLKSVKARKGQWVSTGDRIGEVGSTGRSTGPHLHFEVIEGIVEVDPLAYLPAA